jgi:Zn-dependent protease with chaperone function
MPEISFDFKKYIEQRRGQDLALARSGAAYAYPGDQKVLRTLGKVTPVTLAVEATVRLWKNVAKSEILGTSVKVTDKQFPELNQIAVECASRLHIAPPTIYVYPEVGALNAHTFGTNDDSYIVLNGVLVDHLSSEELRFVIGHECGHIQNNHVVYITALYYLMYSANLFVRWIVTPAVLALQSWTRRAEITCDRAGLICSGDPDAALAALTKLALGSSKLAERLDVEEYLKQLEESQEGAGRLMELFHSHPYLPKRVQAIRLFAQTHYYLKAAGTEPPGEEGKSLAWCDARVKRILSIFSRKKEQDAGAEQEPPSRESEEGGSDDTGTTTDDSGN